MTATLKKIVKMLRTNKTLNKISITHQQKLLRKSEIREITAKGRYMDK